MVGAKSCGRVPERRQKVVPLTARQRFCDLWAAALVCGRLVRQLITPKGSRAAALNDL
jgi:hypothetical protein